LKKFCKFVLIFLLVNVVTFNFVLADNVSDSQSTEVNTTNQQESTVDNNSTGAPIQISGPVVDTEKIEDGIGNVAEKGKSLMYTVIETIGDISLPIAFLLVLWGSVLYFILGIRNLYKKRQGLLLMWGAITFVVIAKIMVLVGWFIFEYKA